MAETIITVRMKHRGMQIKDYNFLRPISAKNIFCHLCESAASQKLTGIQSIELLVDAESLCTVRFHPIRR